MARFSRLEVLNTIVAQGLVPIFYHKEAETARQIARAVVAGGCRLLEFTNRGDHALDIFRELALACSQEAPDLIIGAGSIVDAPTAALYIAAGANFIVGPLLNPEVARLCNRRKVAYLPGCGSVSEISAAEELGVEIVKVFPANAVGGPAFVKEVLGPCPWTRILPTGGIEADRAALAAWFAAGVTAVGLGSSLLSKALIAAGDYDGIAARVAQTLGWIRELRGERLFQGVEHVGLYPREGATAAQMAAWYADLFGFEATEGPGSFFLEGGGPGRIEACKEATDDRPHLAIRVSDFEAAMAALRARGVELEEPTITPTTRVAFLKQRDPAGHRVHLLWRR